MITNASTLAGGRPTAANGRIGPGAVVRHWLLVGRRDLLQIRSNPQLLIRADPADPVVLLFVYGFGGAISGSSRQYVQYVILGIIVQTVVFATAMTGIGLNEDLAKGVIDRFRSLPIARSAVLAGRILADAVRLVASLAVILAVGTLLGFDHHRPHRRPGRVRADHRLRYGPVVGGRPDRAVGPQPRDGPVGRVHLDVPAHLASRCLPRPRRCRAGAAVRGGQPDHRGHRRPPRPAARRPGALAGAPDPGLDRRLTVVFAPLAIRQFRRLS